LQILLITSTLPTFLPVLDGKQRKLVENFFIPQKDAAKSTLPIRRAIALNTYLTTGSLLSTSKKDTPSPSIPIPTREFVLGLAEQVVKVYSIDDLYWAVYSASSEYRDGVQTLLWEDAVKVAVGIPGKVANAVGRWRQDGWNGDIPAGLYPR